MGDEPLAFPDEDQEKFPLVELTTLMTVLVSSLILTDASVEARLI